MLKDFTEVSFAPGPGGKQEKVVLSVLAGSYDIGTVREGTLELMRGRVDLDQIRIVAKTRAYPGWSFSARAGLDPAIVESLGKAMFALRYDAPADRAILERARIRGIIPSEDGDFDAVRELAARMKLF